MILTINRDYRISTNHRLSTKSIYKRNSLHRIAQFYDISNDFARFSFFKEKTGSHSEPARGQTTEFIGFEDWLGSPHWPCC